MGRIYFIVCALCLTAFANPTGAPDLDRLVIESDAIVVRHLHVQKFLKGSLVSIGNLSGLPVVDGLFFLKREGTGISVLSSLPAASLPLPSYSYSESTRVQEKVL